MKDTSKKLLLLLGQAGSEELWFSTKKLELFFPELTHAGYLSLLFLLEKKELIRINKLEGSWLLSLSPYGETALKELFPAFYLPSGELEQDSQLVLFLESISSDKNFRYLRNLLLKNQAIPLGRGSFLFIGGLPQVIREELQKHYRNAVLVLAVADWIVGDRYKVIGQRISAKDHFDIYSGVSREIERLTQLKSNQKGFMDTENKEFLLVFHRFLDLLTDLHPLFFRYFPQVEKPLELLEKIQKSFLL